MTKFSQHQRHSIYSKLDYKSNALYTNVTVIYRYKYKIV